MGFKDVVDKVKDALGLGPDSWEERMLESCDLESPSGKTFSPRWRGDTRSFAKKLAVFEYPGLPGAIVQDLDVRSSVFTLTLYFSGKDSDLDAQDFFEECKSRGLWKITHPMYGGYTLQLVSVSEDTQPVTSGGVVKFTTEWMEPLDPSTLQAAGQTGGLIDKLKKDLNISAAQQFANNVYQGATSAVQAIEDATDVVTGAMELATEPLFTTLDAIDNVVTGIQRSIQDIKTQSTIITDSLSGQIQALAQVTARANKSAKEKIEAYYDAVTSLDARMIIEESIPPGPNPLNKKNAVATLELGQLATVGAVADAIRLSDPGTRAAAIDLVERTEELFDDVLTSLDRGQQIFDDLDIDEQFVSQTESAALASQLMAACAQYLFLLAPSLKVERRLTVKKPTTPIELVLRETGDVENLGTNLDVFIETNQLEGKEILMLAPGREVVVYV